jgi:pimeloyl-ACP methyl ester carboxylesterase
VVAIGRVRVFEPMRGPEGDAPEEEVELEAGALAPRLVRHRITLASGHRVGLAVSGRGIPLVVVHGFSAEGILYAQTLSRLVGMGYKVIAVDTAGHGGTQGLPRGGGDLADYAGLLGQVVRELGIKRAVFAGHSMGGRLVAELAAQEPEKAMAVLLLDAIVGDTWDRIALSYRFFPPALSVTGALLAADSISTLPLFKDRTQALKLFRLAIPVGMGNLMKPYRMLGPSISVIRSGPSRPVLERLADHRVPTFVIHGDHDYAVPFSTARSAAERANGVLVRVHGASHSWLLKDPETLPGIVTDLLQGDLGAAQRHALWEAGLTPGETTLDEVESAFYDRGALVLDLSPEAQPVAGDAAAEGHTTVELRPSTHRWTIERP